MKNITREQYNKALDIVEAYHKKLSVDKIKIENSEKTPNKEWLESNACSTRLRNIIYYDDYFKYIEDWEKKEFIRIRGAGLKTWNEFERLRGF
ncbi:hypothetical protein ACJRPK_13990 [Aquimarina sp. 2-A2]|uniref:hypothetical protein n=1 Tax=Aquimarina sp. 2-A2 TaxID=3382644 RepID=UPI00387EF29A